MGNFIWHEWARFVSIAASIYSMWAGYWGLFYRKYMWDFVDGTLRDPGGLQPSRAAMPLINVIVKAPVLQIMLIVLAACILSLELPAPILKKTSLYRSLAVRLVLLIAQATVGILVYQATNGALYSLIAAFGYGMAQMKGEEMQEAKDNRGSIGGA